MVEHVVIAFLQIGVTGVVLGVRGIRGTVAEEHELVTFLELGKIANRLTQGRDDICGLHGRQAQQSEERRKKKVAFLHKKGI